MRTSLIIGVAPLAALALAGCGSSKKTTSSGAVVVKSVSYRVKMAGKGEVPPGAPSGSGAALIAIHAKTDEVCWKFSSLVDVPAPLMSHIHKGAAGTAGPIVIPLGGKFKPVGCIKSSASLLAAIEKSPEGYYVNIHNAKYPGGAVRAQL